MSPQACVAVTVGMWNGIFLPAWVPSALHYLRRVLTGTTMQLILPLATQRQHPMARAKGSVPQDDCPLRMPGTRPGTKPPVLQTDWLQTRGSLTLPPSHSITLLGWLPQPWEARSQADEEEHGVRRRGASRARASVLREPQCATPRRVHRPGGSSAVPVPEYLQSFHLQLQPLPGGQWVGL